MIYLDNQATTPCDPAVIDAMTWELKTYVANPSSNHEPGELASRRVNWAISQIAEIIGADPGQIILTSGATESNNLAILGLTDSIPGSAHRKKIITTQIEHKSVLGPVQHLEKKGWEVKYLPINNDGLVRLGDAAAMINSDVALVSVQLANSEIGTIQPVEALANMARSAGAVFHCDAAQAIGKIPVTVTSLGVDLLSFSAHKLYGPQGIGALWITPGFEKLLSPILYGGGNTLRPGTIPTALAIGFGVACELINKDFGKDYHYVIALRNHFETLLKKSLPGIVINGSEQRLPNNSNITFPDADAEALLAQLGDVIASTGSACESGSIEPSRILTAIGLNSDTAYSTIRFGFGRFNTESQINEAVNRIAKVYQTIVAFSN
jgi:cysteine desulfurase